MRSKVESIDLNGIRDIQDNINSSHEWHYTVHDIITELRKQQSENNNNDENE